MIFALLGILGPLRSLLPLYLSEILSNILH